MNDYTTINDQRFRTNKIIGKGGMATVYRAVDTVNGGVVAFKLYDHSSIRQTALKEAFHREVEALQYMDHPHIVKYIEKGEKDGAPFIVMELLPKSIQEWVDYRKDDIGGWDDLYEYFVKPLISSLKYSHTKKVAHRDIKPSNIRFNDDYELKLIDYNICINQHKDKIDDGALESFNTKKYSPNEADWYDSPYRRDVYGFAVTCVEVMARIYNIDTAIYPNLKEIFDHSDFDWPEDIAEIFRKILDYSADSQYNCSDLFDSIEKIQRSRNEEQERTIRAESVPIFILKDLNKEINLEDLAGYTWISSRIAKGPESFWLYGKNYQYWVTLENKYLSFNTQCFVVRNVLQPEFPNELEELKKTSLKLNLKYKVNPTIGKNYLSLDQLVNEVRDHEQANKESESSNSLKNSLDYILDKKWDSIKKINKYKWELKGELMYIPELRGSAVAISETQFEILTLGGRLVCRARLKMRGADQYDYECIDSEAKLPNTGIIKEDNNYARRQNEIQKKIVEKVFSEDISNPRLSTILNNPIEASFADYEPKVNFFNEKLDTSKRECVNKFITAKDFLLIEGPPGTGKTDLIVELLNQQIDRKSNSKILVVSETNVAIDNILERLEHSGPKLDYVRIGSQDNKKISTKAQDFLVETQSKYWIDEIKYKTIEFLNCWSRDNNLDIEEIKLYSTIQRYCFKLEDINRYHEKAENEKNEIQNEPESLKQLSIELKAHKKELEAEKKALLSIKNGAQWLEDIESAGSQYVLELIQTHFDNDLIRKKAKQLMDLSNEWLNRFPGSEQSDLVLVQSKQIVFSTTMLLAMTHRYKDLQFDLVILDEASKSAIIESIVPLSSGKKWVLLGDRKQLPPFLDNRGGDLDSNEIEKLSLFNYLLDNNLSESCKHFLTKQYRMSPGICKLISQNFYDDKLESGTKIENNNFLGFRGKEIIWIDTSMEDTRKDNRNKSGSFINPLEVNIVEKVFMSLEQYCKDIEKSPKNSVLVISGYSGQVDKLRQTIGTRFKNFTHRINTIDACQGHEADIVIFSLVRSNEKGNIGFMREMERLNVGLSRAKKGLIIIGDLVFCSKDDGYLGKVASFIKNNPSICGSMLPKDFAGGL